MSQARPRRKRCRSPVWSLRWSVVRRTSRSGRAGP